MVTVAWRSSPAGQQGIDMAAAGVEQILIVSPRYADDVASAVAVSGFTPIIERRGQSAISRFTDSQLKVVVVDARGALEPGLTTAAALGPEVEARRGGLLVLLSRSDAGAAAAAQDAGATSVLVSPFGGEAFGNAVRLTVRNTRRLADVESQRTDFDEDRDRLTGLASGDQLQDHVAGALADAAKPSVFVLAIGIGRIAAINAAYGRGVADQALSAVAARLSALVQADPASALWLARLAAAEFAIGLSGELRMTTIMQLADTVIACFADPFVIGDHVLHLSARIGIASNVLQNNVLDAEVLVRQASAALSEARTGDAGSIVMFRPDPMGDPLTRRANLVADLHKAIDDGDIMLIYQPQLTLGNGRLTGVEALARWDHRLQGVLPAETLLQTAEAADLAIKLGRHIRAQAMAEAARWNGSLADIKLSVNVTAADLADPGFTEALAAAIANSGLSCDRLMLEVTEGALIGDIDAAARVLEGLRALGVRIALDDFGTGYSSLFWLARLPVDAIKIDRSFMLGLMGTAREKMVIRAVINLAKDLGLNVICEGVEDDEQLAAARAVGCDVIQGYQIAAPMRSTRLQQFCSDWASV
ncbi:MAG: GGDEF-domain containing protein [Alphaproteobacteria bacterium PA4]|nr:MAG: GGDEF-domain containing protein [Alphaproteobacteria bacterium PA4]